MQNYSKSFNFATIPHAVKLGKRIKYTYNPETDNFERLYYTFKERLLMGAKTFGFSLVLAALIFIFVFYVFDTPTEKNLKAENKRLKSQYGILNRRLDNALEVMDHLQDRDENLYRVMLQLDPLSTTRRLTGLDNKVNLYDIDKTSDSRLMKEAANKISLFERQIYSQLQSIDQITNAIDQQNAKLPHIPSVIPVKLTDYTMSSGYGYRLDPIYGTVKFHEGLDFSAPMGTDVYATADGKISLARRQAGYGNCVEIDHGYNYLTRYAHLSEIKVKEGEEIKRGQLIGSVGSTGKSTGPHLHYEVRFKDEPQNPVYYYFQDLTPEEYNMMIQMAEDAGRVMD